MLRQGTAPPVVKGPRRLGATSQRERQASESASEASSAVGESSLAAVNAAQQMRAAAAICAVAQETGECPSVACPTGPPVAVPGFASSLDARSPAASSLGPLGRVMPLSSACLPARADEPQANLTLRSGAPSGDERLAHESEPILSSLASGSQSGSSAPPPGAMLVSALRDDAMSSDSLVGEPGRQTSPGDSAPRVRWDGPPRSGSASVSGSDSLERSASRLSAAGLPLASGPSAGSDSLDRGTLAPRAVEDVGRVSRPSPNTRVEAAAESPLGSPLPEDILSTTWHMPRSDDEVAASSPAPSPELREPAPRYMIPRSGSGPGALPVVAGPPAAGRTARRERRLARDRAASARPEESEAATVVRIATAYC